MIQHIFSLACTAVSVDGPTNVLSVFNILEQLTIFAQVNETVQVPIMHEILSEWTRSDLAVPETGKMRIVFCSPDNVCKPQNEIEINLSESLYFRTRLAVGSIFLKDPGVYKYIIELNQGPENSWAPVATIPLSIVFASPETASQQP